MTIRTRLTLWYAGILLLALLVTGWGAYRAMLGQSHRPQPDEAGPDSPEHQALKETAEMMVVTGLPVVCLGLLGGWWLTRRALAPVAKLTQAMEKIQPQHLPEPPPRKGSGDELDRLTEVFKAMTARLDGAFNRVRELTLRAAREFKAPLAVLGAEMEAARRDESLSEPEQERVTRQLDELRRLTRMVEGLAWLTQADAGQIVLTQEPVRWDELIRDNFADALIQAQPLGIRVELSAREAVTILGDRQRLRQLLLNLTDNAVKYNRSHGHILMVLRRVGDTAEFAISNTGKGIPPEILPRIFDRFFRDNSSPGKTAEGCGLGLSIAQWIVTAHQGTITVESPETELTMVRVRLPVYIIPA